MASLGMRVSTMGINGKIVRAVLQRQIAHPREDGTPQVLWEDVRELEVTEDGTVVLSRSSEQEQAHGKDDHTETTNASPQN